MLPAVVVKTFLHGSQTWHLLGTISPPLDQREREQKKMKWEKKKKKRRKTNIYKKGHAEPDLFRVKFQMLTAQNSNQIFKKKNKKHLNPVNVCYDAYDQILKQACLLFNS